MRSCSLQTPRPTVVRALFLLCALTLPGCLDGLLGGEGSDYCGHTRRPLGEWESVEAPSGELITREDLLARVACSRSGPLSWLQTGQQTVAHLTIAARPDTDIVVRQYCDHLEGFDVPAYLTFSTEDDVVNQGFTGVVALTTRLDIISREALTLAIVPDEAQVNRFANRGLDRTCQASGIYSLELQASHSGECPFRSAQIITSAAYDPDAGERIEGCLLGAVAFE